MHGPTTNRPAKQLGMVFHTWGGSRAGAGRKPLVPGRAPHVCRPLLASRFPVHVTMKIDESLPDLRDEHICWQIEECLRTGKGGERFRLVHYSILTHHLHLIVEAANAEELTEGIRGLSIRLARRINRIAGRRGRVFVDRYFARLLKTPRQTRAAIAYVLLNCRRHAAQHGRKLLADWMDQCSSGRFFDGWRQTGVKPRPEEQPTVTAAGTWLLRTGWRRWGLLRVDEIPGPEAALAVGA
jgi:putative transposase